MNQSTKFIQKLQNTKGIKSDNFAIAFEMYLIPIHEFVVVVKIDGRLYMYNRLKWKRSSASPYTKICK